MITVYSDATSGTTASYLGYSDISTTTWMPSTSATSSTSDIPRLKRYIFYHGCLIAIISYDVACGPPPMSATEVKLPPVSFQRACLPHFARPDTGKLWTPTQCNPPRTQFNRRILRCDRKGIGLRLKRSN